MDIHVSETEQFTTLGTGHCHIPGKEDSILNAMCGMENPGIIWCPNCKFLLTSEKFPGEKNLLVNVMIRAFKKARGKFFQR
jgi:hypothetical protein